MRNYKSRKGVHCEELTNGVGEYIRKCKATIKHITEELLGDKCAKVELDWLVHQKAFI